MLPLRKLGICERRKNGGIDARSPIQILLILVGHSRDASWLVFLVRTCLDRRKSKGSISKYKTWDCTESASSSISWRITCATIQPNHSFRKTLVGPVATAINMLCLGFVRWEGIDVRSPVHRGRLKRSSCDEADTSVQRCLDHHY